MWGRSRVVFPSRGSGRSPEWVDRWYAYYFHPRIYGAYKRQPLLVQARASGEVLVNLLSSGKRSGPAILLVSRGHDPSLEGELRAEMMGAAAWTQHPNALSGDDVVARALRALREAGAPGAHVVGQCEGLPSGVPATTTELEALLGGESGASPSLVVLCGGDRTEERLLLREATRLAGVASSESEAPMTVVLALTGRAHALAAEGRGRALGATAAPTPGWSKYAARNRTSNYTVCDPVCKTQTKFLEALIVFVVVAMAVGVILTCLHIIDTPTRFPPTKEGTRQHHD